MSADVRGRHVTQDFTRLGRADCWLEGMREATGNTGWTRQAEALGTMKMLEGVLASSAPAEGDGFDWARELALEYARANLGTTLSVFAFKAWLQSGKPARPAPRGRSRPGDDFEGNPNPVTEAFELTAYDEARIARAREKKQRAGGGT